MSTRAAFLVTLSLLSTLGFSPYAQAGDHSDEAGIVAAVTDYVMSAYDVAPERVDRSVHPKLQKVGYIQRWRRRDL